jgi:hypothetical protein
LKAILISPDSCSIEMIDISGRFQLEHLAPVAGRAVIAGGADGGNTLHDAVMDIDALRSRIKYL